MSEGGNEGGNPSEKKRGFFARLMGDAVTEGPASQQDLSHSEAPVSVAASEPNPPPPGVGGAQDESRFSRFRRAFSWGQDEGKSEQQQAAPMPLPTSETEAATSPADLSPAIVTELTAEPETQAVAQAVVEQPVISPVSDVAPAPLSPVAPPPVAVEPAPPVVASPQSPLVPEPVKATAHLPKEDRFGKIKRALARTRKGLGRLFLGRKQIDDELLESLETHLLTADLGVEVTAEVIEALTDRVKRNELSNVDALHSALRGLLIEILKPCESPLNIDGKAPFVLLVVGVNGVGKTTTIGKLARQYLKQGKSVMLAAGDTFRAAAVEQLQIWGERNHVPVVAQHTGADSASVIYDAFESAKARHTGLLIADTAGRLHTKSNLMDELKKIKRVLGKLDGHAPHEVLLVLDAGTGQNAVNQLQQFHEAVGVTGIVLTKLDGTAKGGVIFALCRRFGIPVRFIGVGEGMDDLQPFRAEDFVDALLATDSQG